MFPLRQNAAIFYSIALIVPLKYFEFYPRSGPWPWCSRYDWNPLCVYFIGAVCLCEEEHTNCTWSRTKTSDLRPPEWCLAPLPNRLPGALIAAREGLDFTAVTEPSIRFHLDCEQAAKLTYEVQTELWYTFTEMSGVKKHISQINYKCPS